MTFDLRALSLTQPWATLVFLGFKEYETRTWGPRPPPGLIAIHAALKMPGYAKDLAGCNMVRGLLKCEPAALPLGAIVGVGFVSNVDKMGAHTAHGVSDQERRFGDWTAGRFAWRFDWALALFEPIPCKGALSLWKVPAEIAEQLVTPDGYLVPQKWRTDVRILMQGEDETPTPTGLSGMVRRFPGFD